MIKLTAHVLWRVIHDISKTKRAKFDAKYFKMFEENFKY